MVVAAWSVVGFLVGSIPFSVMVGRLAKQADIRQFGDQNPGSANVVRAAGWGWGALALLLDCLKSAIPTGLAWFGAGLNGWQIVPIALSPILGHAFSPWLGFRGGKAVAATFGTWVGLTVGAGPTVLGLLLGVFFGLLKSSGWAVIFSFLCFGLFVGSFYGAAYPEFLWVWAGNLAILVWKHRKELYEFPKIRSGLLARFRRNA